MTREESSYSSLIKGLLKWLALVAAFAIPLKLSWAYVALAILLPLWLNERRSQISDIFQSLPRALWLPIAFWLIVAGLSACFGFNPLHSLSQLVAFMVIVLALPVFYDLSTFVGAYKILLALLAGQSLAAIHSIAEGLMPIALQGLLIGKVTESGQLALTSVVAIGLVLQAWAHRNINLTRCAIIIVPLLSTALLVNLKRGPWLGVTIAILMLLSRSHKRFILPILIAITLIASQLSPIRARLEQSYQDYMISGGRNMMWQIGVELAAKHPLGIGYGNSKMMRDYDPSIPESHRHLHNNLLNILVETGWLGLMVYLWWIFSVVKFAFSRRANMLSFSIGCAVLSWQIAGLVEYNFGDSEVMLVVFLLLGILPAIKREQASLTPPA